MCKASANKDHEKIADLAKRYKYYESQKEPLWPLNRGLATLAKLNPCTKAYEQKFVAHSV